MNYKSNFYHEVNLELYDNVYPIIKRGINNHLNVFLIGKDVKEKGSFRAKVQNGINSYRNKIKVYFPERIFEDQIFQQKYDLLSLENILANSVDAVVMCLESPGSFAELGAFSNHKELKNKLIILIDKKYSRAKSFINLGPIKHLKQHSNAKIFEVDYKEPFKEDKVKKLEAFIKDIRKNNHIKHSLTNPIFAEQYLLSLLYIFENLSRKEIINILKGMNIDEDGELVISIVTSSINTLSHQRDILYNNVYKSYALSERGKRHLKSIYNSNQFVLTLDNLRLKVLNFQLRG